MSTSSGNTFIRSITTSTTGTALIQAAGDSTQTVVLRTWGTANAGALFGQTLSGWSGLYSEGAASNGLIVGTFTSKPLLFGTANTERARIDSSGNLLVGRTSVYGGATYKLQIGNSAGNPWFTVNDNGTGSNVGMMCGSTSSNQISTQNTSSTSNTIIEFGRSATGTGNYTACGKLWLDGSGNFAAANSSDVRFKENIVDLPNGLATVMALKPRQFDWIDDADRKQVKGFVAQEVENVLPRSVGEDKDGYKLISMETELFPILVKAIQEQQAIIESLKARLDAANL